MAASPVKLSPAQFAEFILADSKLHQEQLTGDLCSEIVVERRSGGGTFTQ